MKTLTGKVSRLRHTTSLQQGLLASDRGTSVRTRYLALFEIEGRAVQYAAEQPAVLGDGDYVGVVGEFNRNGIFEAVAYLNESNQVRGNNGVHWYFIAFGVIAIVTGLAVLSFGLTLPADWIVALLMISFGLTGAICIQVGWHSWKAIRSLYNDNYSTRQTISSQRSV